MDLLVRGIGRLLTMTAPRGSNRTDDVVTDAAVVVRGGQIAWCGRESDLPADLPNLPEVDVVGAVVLPGFVDAHTHLVWAGSRREEFAARLAGEAYDGGGIRTTVTATRAASDDELLALAEQRAWSAIGTGTTTMEVKTGYGLTVYDELRQLDVIAQLGERLPIRLEPTYLGAHVVPDGRDADEYVAEVVATVEAAKEHGARWVDVFCDEGVFSVAQARRVLQAGREAGLGLRLHAEEIAHTGAAALAAEMGCASADHLEHVSAADAAAMAEARVVGVLLPTVTLSLRTFAFGQVDVLQMAGVELAIATDCNPGTSWCESMPYAVQLACLVYGLPVRTALRAATRGGASALRRDDVGVIEPGRLGDLVVLATDHETDLVAHLGAPAVSHTIQGGRVVASGGGPVR
ncbi:MAG: imidazolonepropionase [Actinomycetes bacterium]